MAGGRVGCSEWSLALLRLLSRSQQLRACQNGGAWATRLVDGACGGSADGEDGEDACSADGEDACSADLARPPPSSASSPDPIQQLDGRRDQATQQTEHVTPRATMRSSQLQQYVRCAAPGARGSARRRCSQQCACGVQKRLKGARSLLMVRCTRSGMARLGPLHRDVNLVEHLTYLLSRHSDSLALLQTPGAPHAQCHGHAAQAPSKLYLLPLWWRC